MSKSKVPQEPQIEITADDLVKVVQLVDIAVRVEGRRVIPSFEPLAQKVEKYLTELAAFSQAKDAETPTAKAE